MAKRQVRYVTCNRCGYRGVSGDHQCDPIRLVAGENVGAGIAAVNASGRVVAPPRPRAEDSFGSTQALKLGADLRSLLQRPVEVIALSGTYEVRQRCPACGETIDKVGGARDTYTDTFAAIGTAARKTYLLHACPPVEASLLGFTWDELEELHATLERDVNRIGERQQQIEKLRKERQT